MKIGHPADKPAPTAGNVPAAAPAATNAVKGQAKHATAAIPPEAEHSAKIELSSTASTLLNQGVSPEFDAEKVQRISAAIDQGTFRVNPEAIADKLIANAKEVLAKVQP